MIKLDAGNVLMKPSQRKQVMAWLRRALKLGERIGDFVLSITLRQTGKFYELKAAVHDRVGDFNCRVRQQDWIHAFRDLARELASRLHGQKLARFAT